MIEAVDFPDAAAFSDWLDAHHARSGEVWVLFHRKGSGITGPTWSEAVDVALCFGWIDGLRKRVDERSYQIRFTPRTPNSVWSAVNVKKVEELMRSGRMRPEGIDLFNSRTDTRGYSAETRQAELSEPLELRFRAHHEAWVRFSSLAPSYRRDAIWWVMSAKKEQTRSRRLEILVSCSALGKRVPVLGS